MNPSSEWILPSDVIKNMSKWELLLYTKEHVTKAVVSVSEIAARVAISTPNDSPERELVYSVFKDIVSVFERLPAVEQVVDPDPAMAVDKTVPL